MCEGWEILETIEAYSWDRVLTEENNLKTTEYQELIANSTNKDLKIGWLSPEGKMHYCKFEEHITYVHCILKSDVPTIESKGWLHIRYKEDTIIPRHGKKMTQAQAYTIREELGLKVYDDDVLYQ